MSATVWVPNDCQVSTPALAVGFKHREHVHACTGPATHSGQEHLCACGAWFKVATT